MKKVYRRLPKAKPDPVSIKFKAGEVKKETLVMPEISYQVIANTEMKAVFTGDITPLPTTLIFYLNHAELMIVATIMSETTTNGECNLNIREMARRIYASEVTVCNAISALRKSGLLLEKKSGVRNSKSRIINYEALQHLNDVLEGENPGIYARIRGKLRKKNIFNITKEDVMNAYDNKILPPDHDPMEEEEYD